LRNFEKKNFTFRTKKISKKILHPKNKKMLIEKKIASKSKEKKVFGKIFGR